MLREDTIQTETYQSIETVIVEIEDIINNHALLTDKMGTIHICDLIAVLSLRLNKTIQEVWAMDFLAQLIIYLRQKPASDEILDDEHAHIKQYIRISVSN